MKRSKLYVLAAASLLCLGMALAAMALPGCNADQDNSIANALNKGAAGIQAVQSAETQPAVAAVIATGQAVVPQAVPIFTAANAGMSVALVALTALAALFKAQANNKQSILETIVNAMDPEHIATVASKVNSDVQAVLVSHAATGTPAAKT